MKDGERALYFYLQIPARSLRPILPDDFGFGLPFFPDGIRAENIEDSELGFSGNKTMRADIVVGDTSFPEFRDKIPPDFLLSPPFQGSRQEMKSQ